MAASVNKISARIAALEQSLDDLEAQIEPLLAQTLPETVVGLEKVQQAKLQVALPYLVYDLVFIYLKTKGIDPKTHPVVAELDRVRQYFDKIKDAEDPAKRTLAIDKGVANRFIKHAIAQVKYGRPPGQDEGIPAAESVRVPVKMTRKMLDRAEYEKELKEQESEDEDDLDIIDDVQESSESSAPSSSKGKEIATADDLLTDIAQTVTSQKRPRPVADAFAGYGDEAEDRTKVARPTTEDMETSREGSDPGTPRADAGPVAGRQTPKKSKRKTVQRGNLTGS